MDVWPGLTHANHRFAMIDLTQDGEYCLPLVSGNGWQVGELTALVQNGKIAVSYHLFGEKTQVFKERLHFLLPGDTITRDFAQTDRQGKKISKEHPVFHTLPKADVLLLYIRLDVLFDEQDSANRFINWEEAPWSAYQNNSYAPQYHEILKMFPAEIQ